MIGINFQISDVFLQNLKGIKIVCPELIVEFFKKKAFPHLEIMFQQRGIYSDDHTSVLNIHTFNFTEKAFIQIIFQEIPDLKSQQLIFKTINLRKRPDQLRRLEFTFFLLFHL